MSAPPRPAPPPEVYFHDAECGGYAADLPLWRALADRGPEGVIFDLGAGTGRTALELASDGHPVVAVERDRSLAHELAVRAEARGLATRLRIECADAARLPTAGTRASLVIAPMQFAQLLDRAALAAVLRWSASVLQGDGLLAVSILDEREQLGSGTAEPLPDVREADGWIYSSLPLAVDVGPNRIEIVRLRQTVSPDGELSERRHVEVLHPLSRAALAELAIEAGLHELGVEQVPATADHVGSVVLVFGHETRDG